MYKIHFDEFVIDLLCFISTDCSRMSPAADELQKVSLHIQSVAKQGSINQSGSGILTDFFRLSALLISGFSEWKLRWN